MHATYILSSLKTCLYTQFNISSYIRTYIQYVPSLGRKSIFLLGAVWHGGRFGMDAQNILLRQHALIHGLAAQELAAALQDAQDLPQSTLQHMVLVNVYQCKRVCMHACMQVQHVDLLPSYESICSTTIFTAFNCKNIIPH